MDRLRRLSTLWNWLPAFRAVAEIGHLTQAAAELGVVPSALSRTVKLLEAQVGRPLFDRIGRTMRLNRDGEQLLIAVRDAMRRVDDAAGLLAATALDGDIHIGVTEDYLLDIGAHAGGTIQAEHPGLVPHVVHVESAHSGPMLLRGALDIVFASDVPASGRLDIDRLAKIDYGIYCGSGHRLYRSRKVRLADLAAFPFVAPVNHSGNPVDPWPPELARVIAMYVPAWEPTINVCERGELLAVLPDLGVARGGGHDLRRLPVEALPPALLYSVRRPPLGGGRREALILEAVRAELGIAARAGKGQKPLSDRGRNRAAVFR